MSRVWIVGKITDYEGLEIRQVCGDPARARTAAIELMLADHRIDAAPPELVAAECPWLELNPDCGEAAWRYSDMFTWTVVCHEVV